MLVDASNPQKTSIEFKSTTISVPVLVLYENDLNRIKELLVEKVKQAPEFFKNSPIIIDFQKLLALNENIQLDQIIKLLREQGFLPIGIRGGNDAQKIESIANHLPVYSIQSQNDQVLEKKAENKSQVSKNQITEVAMEPVENKFISQPIRSGQRVYSKGDLIIAATVSAGAEIMAEGNIHVYGTLHGRALAGVLGNTESRIFCSDLRAELISIAGIYQLQDESKKQYHQRPVQISLDKQTLIIKDI